MYIHLFRWEVNSTVQNIGVLNIKQLLQNPTGKFSSYMARRDKTIEDLDNRYFQLLNKAKTFKFKVYKVKDNYLFHFYIPSEEFPDSLFYNVCVLFESHNELTGSEKTINNHHLKLFSNSPNFMFTYTYALNQNKMIIPFLINKCAKRALTEAPTLRNPIEVYGFEKSIYFACRFIMDNQLNSIFEIENNRFLFNEAKLKSEIATQESKYEEQKRIKKEVAEKKRENKKLAKGMQNSTTVNKFKTQAEKKEQKQSTPKRKAVRVIKRKK